MAIGAITRQDSLLFDSANSEKLMITNRAFAYRSEMSVKGGKSVFRKMPANELSWLTGNCNQARHGIDTDMNYFPNRSKRCQPTKLSLQHFA